MVSRSSQLDEPMDEHPDIIPIEIENEYALHDGQNLPNHSSSLRGHGKFIMAGRADRVTFRTKQQVYRFCAWALAMSEVLPDEDGEHTFEEVQEAIKNS